MDKINRVIDTVERTHSYPPFVARLPKPVSWFLGYRSQPPKKENWFVKEASIFLVTFVCILTNEAMAIHAPLLQKWGVPILVPSFAASAVLLFGSLGTPLAQPRNFVFGHFLAGLIGVCVCKLFMTNPANEKHLWLAAALSVAAASTVMDITGTVHPPAGATALIPCSNAGIRKLGWDFLPLLLIHSALFLGFALLLNNVVRQYPKYFWSPKAPLTKPAPVPQNVTTGEFKSISIDSGSIRIPYGISLTPADNEALARMQSYFREDA